MKNILFAFFLIALVACGNSEPENNLEAVKTDAKYGDSTGVFEEYYPNGKMRIKGYLTNGKRDGVWNYFYENGYTWSKGVYKNGVRDGYSMTYHENGVKNMQGQYKAGEKAGVWKFWSAEGDLLKRSQR